MPVLGPADILSKLLPATSWGKQENCTELAEQAGLWRRTRMGDQYPCIQWRLLLQMVQYFLDDHRIFDTSNDVHERTNAVGAGCAGTATFAVPPQARQVSTSMLNTRLSLCAHVIAMDGMYAGFAGAKTGHRHMTLRGRFLILIRCQFPAALAPPGRGHPHPVQAVRCKHTMTNSSGMNLDNRRLPVR
jgi:hypothetical protein